ncbi:MAG: rhodanese-like domain-containing protein [Bacteroidota bacterium]
MMSFSEEIPHTVINVDEARNLIASNADLILLDVRTPEEHAGELGNPGNSLLIPVQELAQRIEELDSCRGKTILVYCRTGNRSGKAAAFLSQRGFTAINMDGGMMEWNERRFPISPPKM